MDVRTLTLMRRNQPQETTLSQLIEKPILHGTAADCAPLEFVSFPHYHYVVLQKCDAAVEHGDVFPAAFDMLKAFKKSYPRNIRDDTGLYRQQSLTLFGEDTDFWTSGNDTVFITMLHLRDPSGISAKKLKAHICGKSAKQSWQYALYYTVDYCDMVLFGKGMPYSEYQKLVYSLVWDPSAKVGDTVTLFCFSRQAFLGQTQSEPCRASGNAPGSDSDRSQMALSVDVSVIERSALTALSADIEALRVSHSLSLIPGHNDVRISIPALTVSQLLKVLMAIDAHCLGFGGYEVLPLLQDTIPALEDAGPSSQPCGRREEQSLWDETQAKSALKELNELNEFVPELLALRRNGFADEFVLSVLPSLQAYIQIKKYLDKPQFQQQELCDKLRTVYFQSLSMLVNSTMHGERQFVQSPSYNYTVFDIPPKLLAFYSAAVYAIAKELNDQANGPSKRGYSFLIAPDFRSDIYVEPILPRCEITDNASVKLIVIYLNEKHFYEPVNALFLLGHEIAHYVGYDTRLREKRAVLILHTISRHLVCKLIPRWTTILEGFIQETANTIAELLLEYYQMDAAPEKKFYTADLDAFLRTSAGLFSILQEPVQNEKMRVALAEKYRLNYDRLQDGLLQYAEDMDAEYGGSYVSGLLLAERTRPAALNLIATWLVGKASDFIYTLYSDHDNDGAVDFMSKWQTILLTFSEAYADLRAIGLMACTLREYSDFAEAYLHRGDLQAYARYMAILQAVFPKEPKDFGPAAPDDGGDELERDFREYLITQLVAYLEACQEKQTGSGLNLKDIAEKLSSGCAETVYTAIESLINRDKMEILGIMQEILGEPAKERQ